MRTKNYLILLAVGCLFGCQQNEQQEQSESTINFSMSIDNNVIKDIPTRSNIGDLYTGKKSFSIGDIVSMATSDYKFNSFTIGKDICSWDDIKTDSKDVMFYAYYPEISSNNQVLSIPQEGVKEHFFGMAEAPKGTKNIALQFKRITIPVIILDEDGYPYNGDAIIKLHLKNQGTIDIQTGMIKVKDNAPIEKIIVKKLSSGLLTNLIPQIIKAGDVFATITVGGQTQEFTAQSTYTMNANNSLLRLSYSGGRLHIVDNEVPLRR